MVAARRPQRGAPTQVFFAWECLRPLLRGLPAYIIPDDVILDPTALTNFVSDNKITRLMTTPNLLTGILQHPGIDFKKKLGHLCCWYLEGEAVPAALVKSWAAVLPEIRLVNAYSTWESLDMCYCDLNPPPLPPSWTTAVSRTTGQARLDVALPGVCAAWCTDRRRVHSNTTSI